MLNVRFAVEDTVRKDIAAVKRSYPKITNEKIYKAGLKALKSKKVTPG